MAVKDLVRARDRLLAAVRDDLPEGQVLKELIVALGDVAMFDRSAVIRVDPDTMLPSAGAAKGFDSDGCIPFWDNELLDPDFVKFNDLARSHDPVATLFEATDGELNRSPRFRKLYEPIGAGDELRVAFSSGRTCWAVGALVRPVGDGPFSTGEIQAVRDLVPVAARALRHAAGRIDDVHRLSGPAMLIIADDGTIESMTSDADALLLDLRTHGIEDTPVAVVAAVRRAKNSRTTARIVVRGSRGIRTVAQTPRFVTRPRRARRGHDRTRPGE